MRLKRLDLHGFKTFPSRAEIIIHPGVTAFVGPNGSGKSNVVDAVRWVLGEQSLSILRCRKTEDLIFAGAPGKAPTGMAEVALLLDNSDHYMDVDYAEATISRRAYRSGENEYLVNRGRVRLKDLAELVAPLRPSQAFVAQGQVDAMLSMRPDERRRLIEDAAQLGLYKLRRAEAERQLARVDGNAVRVRDLVAELEPRLRVLRRQARRTETKRNLEGRLAALTRSISLRLLSTAGERLAASRAAEQLRAERLAEIRTAYEEGLRQARELAVELEARETSLAGLQEERRCTSSEVEKAERETAVIRERLSNLRSQSSSVETELQSISEAQAEEEVELRSLEAELAGLRELGPGKEAEMQVLRRRLDELVAANSERKNSFSERQDRLRDAELELVSVRREAERLQCRLEEADSQVARHQAELSAAAKLHQELQEKQSELRSRVSDCEEADRRARQKCDAARARAEESAKRLRSIQGELAEVKERQRATGVRLELARQAHESYSGYPKAVQELMTGLGPRKRLSGLLGTAGDLLEVPEQFEVAIETALGGHAFDVVTECWRDAEAAIEQLKQEKCGRCTFLPLDTVSRSAVPAVPRLPGVVGTALDLVSFDLRYGNVFGHLLGRVVVVEDLPAAHRLLTRLRLGVTLVTVAGEVVRPSGSVTGGHIARGRVLGRVREIGESEQQLERLGKRLGELQSGAEAAGVESIAAAGDLSTLEAEVEKTRESRRKAESALEEVDSSVSRAARDAEWATSVVERLGRERAQVRHELDGAERRVQLLQELREAVKEELSGWTVAESGASGEESELSARLDSAAAELAALQSRLERGEALQQVHQTNLARLSDRLRTRQLQAAAVREDIDAAEQALQDWEGRRQGLRERADQAERGLRTASEAIRKLREAARSLDSSSAELRDRMLFAEEELRSASVEVERCRAEVQRLESEIGPQIDELGRHLSDSFAEMDFGTLEAETEACRSQLDQIGPVNWMAEEELGEAETRHAFLTGQLHDLRGAETSLQDLIEELDGTAERRFLDVFERVAEEFSTIFTSLFGGGAAELRLATRQDGAASGVEVAVQPPGKRMQNLSLLSGGERALASTALLFALLRASPSPFYVLDEVDAALDEVNVRRFAELVRQLSTDTQFIVITHNRATIEASDILYGVFMSDSATSRLISLSMSEAQKAAAQSHA